MKRHHKFYRDKKLRALSVKISKIRSELNKDHYVNHSHRCYHASLIMTKKARKHPLGRYLGEILGLINDRVILSSIEQIKTVPILPNQIEKDIYLSLSAGQKLCFQKIKRSSSLIPIGSDYSHIQISDEMTMKYEIIPELVSLLGVQVRRYYSPDYCSSSDTNSELKELENKVIRQNLGPRIDKIMNWPKYWAKAQKVKIKAKKQDCLDKQIREEIEDIL